MVKRTYSFPPTHWPWCGWEGGRILFLPNCKQVFPESSEFGWQRTHVIKAIERAANPEPEGLTQLSDKDIVAVELFEDNTIHEQKRGWTPLPDYNDSWELVKLLADIGCGVMVGNQLGMELSYRNMYGGWQGNALGNLTAMSEFILHMGGELRAVGAKPYFAAMDWDILQDAYHGNGILINALNRVGAINYVACGYALIPGTYIRHTSHLMIGDQLREQSKLLGRGFRLPEPGEEFPVLKDYLFYGNFWSGLSGAGGIRAGNLSRCKEYGFKGFGTKLEPNTDIPELAAEFGEDWWK